MKICEVKSSLKFLAVTSLLLLFSTSFKAQTAAQSELPRGVTIEKVVAEKDAAQNYALYLPANYDAGKKWAAIFAFDPSGEGVTPVDIFKEAAEKYGYIVIGSNNSRNNLAGDKLTQAVRILWDDAHSRFNLDERRTYAAGFSGGARVANSFALSCADCFAGVISCGAVFSSGFAPEKPLPYAIFGTAGTGDFNYPELVKSFAKLSEIKSPNRFDTFDGGHRWLPKEMTFDALEWLNLQAMKAGNLAVDKIFVDNILSKQTVKAETAARNGDLIEAARIYENIAADFPDSKATAKKLAALRSQKAYAKARDEEKKSFAEQQKIAAQIIFSETDLADLTAASAARQRISQELEKDLKISKSAADSGERRLARRIISQTSVGAYETALYVNFPRKDYKAMSANLETLRSINPQNADVLFELARAYVFGGRKKDALKTLGEAVKNGFADCSRIKGQNEWSNLREEREFQKIAEQMKCEK